MRYHLPLRFPQPDIVVKPDVLGVGRCTVNDCHAFDRMFGDAPCQNCSRDYCRAHAAHNLPNELLPGLCAECGAAYHASGPEGLARVQVRLFRAYGS